MGHIEIVKEILELYPAAVLAADNDGKTPLHYAAAAKDEGLMYNLLVEFGADEGKVDNVRICQLFISFIFLLLNI